MILKLNKTLLIFLLAGSCFCTICGCDTPRKEPTPLRDINLVMESHVDELMAVPGVVGVYVGMLDDGKDCIVVMVVTLTPELQRKIPTSLEGYAVKLEETGEIKPLNRKTG